MTEQQRFEVRVDVSIRDYRGGGGGLSVSETVTIPAMDFAEMAEVLGEFHKVARKLREAHK
jgi:hypothetical protein